VQEKKNNTGMPDDVLQKMENTYNTDFSNVQIYPDSIRAQELDAAAFTRSSRQGHEIHFAPGQYSPGTTAGQEMLNHELGHVIQQRQGIVKPTTSAKGLPVNDDPALEQQADRMGPVPSHSRPGTQNEANYKSSDSSLIQMQCKTDTSSGIASGTANAANGHKIQLGVLQLNGPDMTPQEAHDHACSSHGMVGYGGANIWGGHGDCMVDSSGTRDFDQYRDEIDRLGKANGCHTCGRYRGYDTPLNARTGNPMQHWVCDHQPPLGIIPDAPEYHLFPQCHDCSNAQWGKSQIYINSFSKHVGREPDSGDAHLFWQQQGRTHRTTADYSRGRY
jgi:hypothetical protein